MGKSATGCFHISREYAMSLKSIRSTEYTVRDAVHVRFAVNPGVRYLLARVTCPLERSRIHPMSFEGLEYLFSVSVVSILDTPRASHC